MYEKFLKFLKSRTIIFSMILAAFGVLEMNMKVLVNYVPEDLYGLLVLGVSMIVAVLRVITTVPIDQK